jgi:ubiquinone/menaquinone biosynthesis C-methylase UbiE
MIERTKALHQTYNDIAEDYSNGIAIINAFYGKFYIKNMPRNRGSVLDVGCGTGDILVQLSKHSEQSFGIGPIKKFVAVAKRRAINSRVQVGSAEDLLFEDNSMDYIISHIVFQHADRSRAINEAIRVLKSGGKLIISEVLSSDSTRQIPAFNFYRHIRLHYFLFSHYGVKQAKQAKAYQASANWKKLTSIHRTRRFDYKYLLDFYSKKLPGAKFKRLDAKIVAIIWQKP